MQLSNVMMAICAFIYVLAPSVGFSQTNLTRELTVSVLNVQNGVPLQHITVVVSFLNARLDKQTEGIKQLQLETDAFGQAKISIPNPVPADLAVDVRLPSKDWHCGCSMLSSVQDVIQAGFLAPSPGKTPNSTMSKYRIKPDVILFLARPTTILEKLLYPIMKE